MQSGNNDPKPVVEPVAGGEPSDLNVRALHQRIRQQEILAELGVSALQGASFHELINETARLAAEGLKADFSKVLEYIASENNFLVRAGVGWAPGVVGASTIGADLASPAGFALKTGKPVISNHLESEDRFRTPELLVRHGVQRAMNVILQGDGRPFGVLEVDSRSDARFVEHDLSFLQGAANILGMAIERDRHERDLKAALERHQFLRKEMNHRVKNSLSIVVSMLRLQARDVGDPNFTSHVEDAAGRVTAIATAHEQLYLASDSEQLDVGRYVASVCKALDLSILGHDILIDTAPGIAISTDRAISAALIVNELVANATKFAYPNKKGGNIFVRVAPAAGDNFIISVRDDGVGLPAEFEIANAKGLGMRIVAALSAQIGATITFRAHNPGAEFIVTASRLP